jgi:hypothetical protein
VNIRTVLSFLLISVVLPLTLAEFSDWCPWLAERLVRWSARQLGDAKDRERYEQEYLAVLEEIPGKGAKLAAAIVFVINAPKMRWALRERQDRTEPPIPAGFIGF